MKAETRESSPRLDRSELHVGKTVRAVNCVCGKEHYGVVEGFDIQHVFVRLFDHDQVSSYRLADLRPCVADELIHDYQATKKKKS